MAFLPDFKRLCQKDYKGGFNTVDFAEDPEGSRKTINAWVAKYTANKILELLSESDITPLTGLVLTNAIYFKGDWKTKFKKEDTDRESFYISPTQSTSVEMMSQHASFNYGIFDSETSLPLQILEMPYAGKNLSMVLLLPDNDIDQFCAKTTAQDLNRWLSSMGECELYVSVPKFKFAEKYQLDETLKKMGMRDAFSKADFGGITDPTSLRIDQVIHQATIEVHEEGSEAAAATAVLMLIVGPSSTPSFRADRPFVFLIRHRGTGAILFMGKVMNPAA